jgi:hypothetical protein
MRQPQHQGVTRPLIAALTAIAFIFSPFSVLAQQEPGPGAEDQQAEDQQAEDQQAEAKKPRGPTPKLFLLPTQGVRDGVSSIIPERVGEMLRAQLQGKSGVKLMASYDDLEVQGGGQANAAVAEAERLYTSGIGLLTAGEDDKASKAFQKAVDIMEQNIADLNNFNVLVDAYKNMALAYFNAGFDFDGRKKMKVFAHLRPDAELDEEKFPKELREVFADEAKKVKKGGPGKLVIEPGEEAMVYIDGVAKGATPVTVEDVGYGYHYLVVRTPTGSVWSEQIRVRGRGKTQKFEVELGGSQAQATGEAQDAGSGEPAFYSGLKQGIKSGSFGKDLQPYLAELTTRTGANFITWVAMIKGKSGYVAVPFIYRTDDGLMVRAQSVEFNFELSNLRVGISQLANHILEAVETMPEDMAITSVELGAPTDKPVVRAEPEDDQQEAVATTQDSGAEATPPAGQQDAVASNEHEQAEESVTPLPEPEPSDKEGESDKWLWLGAGGAAVLVTGLVVGGIVVMSDSGSDEPGNFDAQLTW